MEVAGWCWDGMVDVGLCPAGDLLERIVGRGIAGELRQEQPGPLDGPHAICSAPRDRSRRRGRSVLLACQNDKSIPFVKYGTDFPFSFRRRGGGIVKRTSEQRRGAEGEEQGS